MPNTTVNISLPETMRAQVEEAISTDGYGNTSEFFRDLVREYLKTRQERKLESMLLEAIKSNDFTPLTSEDFTNMKSELAEYIEGKKKEPK